MAAYENSEDFLIYIHASCPSYGIPLYAIRICFPYTMVITSRSSAFKAAKQYVPVYGYATGALLQTVDAPLSSVH